MKAQTKYPSESGSFLTVELLLGKTMEANTGFPKTGLQKGLVLGLGQSNFNNTNAWAAQLGFPKTGVDLALIDFGNPEKIGKAISLIPYLEFDLLKKKTDKWHIHVGIGASYMDTQYDAVTNEFNRAITTKLNWSFRSFLYYRTLRSNNTDWRLGLGYFHHSNGHTRLPNQGLNSFLLSASSLFPLHSKRQATHNDSVNIYKKHKSKQSFFCAESGIGQNVFTEESIAKKEVYTLNLSAGIILNRTFKFGGGLYYRFYENYYDHIKNDGELIEEQVPHFKNAPYCYATNLGLFATSELQLSHISLLWNIGLNLYKPFYKIDYQLNEGIYFYYGDGEKVKLPGELDWYYKVKRTVSSKLGLKYYFINTNKSPKNNFFIGAYINANLGQADFSELGIGYVYRFNYKERK